MLCEHLLEIVDIAMKYKVTIDWDDPYVDHEWRCGMCDGFAMMTSAIEEINAKKENRRSERR